MSWLGCSEVPWVANGAPIAVVLVDAGVYFYHLWGLSKSETGVVPCVFCSVLAQMKSESWRLGPNFTCSQVCDLAHGLFGRDMGGLTKNVTQHLLQLTMWI